MDVNIFSPKIKKYIKKDDQLDIPDLILTLKKSGEKVICYKEKCYWLDLGRMDDYQTAIEGFSKRRDEFLP